MTKSNKPFVFRFKTDNRHYIYDVNTNKVFNVDKVLYSIIEDYNQFSFEKLSEKYSDLFNESDIKNAIDEIRNAQERGVFLQEYPDKMAYGSDLKDLVESEKSEQLILNLTEDCNLRCSYCIYSGKYDGQRTHSKDYMHEDIAFKAVDYFLNNSTDKIYLGFYGGEPLLAYPLLKKVVTYIKGKTEKEINFSLTSNGTVLNDEIIEFFMENNFNLTFSLDGPQEVHDRYRKTAGGNGTWNTVINNLKKIKERDSEYYTTKVLFSVVNAPPLKINKTAEFFENEPLVKDNLITNSYVDTASNTFHESVIDEEDEFDRDKFYNDYTEKRVENESMSNYTKDFYENSIIKFYKRPKTKLESIFPNGCCIPGARRIFVNTKGEFYICEKLDYAYPIGDVETGLDFEKIKKLFDEYVSMSKSCFNCWACRICTNCFASYVSDGRMNEGIRKEECSTIKHSLGKMLVMYYTILENNPKGLDYIEDIELT